MVPSRPRWSDPIAQLRTLRSFAATEEDGGKDLLAAAARVSDPELRGHLERHAADELRHAELFRSRAEQLAEQVAADASAAQDRGRSYDLSRQRRDDLDAHGFFNAGLCDELGEVQYVAMLHVAEQRAARLFDRFRREAAGDPATAAVFEEILRDEKYHVAYTGRILDRWRAEGRTREVERALKSVKTSRGIALWKRLGARSATTFGRFVMYACYWTLLLPFSLAASRGRRSPPSWQPPPTENELTNQY